MKSFSQNVLTAENIQYIITVQNPVHLHDEGTDGGSGLEQYQIHPGEVTRDALHHINALAPRCNAQGYIAK